MSNSRPSLYRRLNRRLRDRMLRPKQEGPITFAKWLGDFFRMFVMILAVGASAMVLYLGPALLNALSLALLGYRAIGNAATVVTVLYWAAVIPVCFVTLMIVMVFAFWEYRSEKWFVPHLGLSVLCVFALGFWLNWFVLAKRINAARHLNNWPRELALTALNVCAIEVNELSSETTAPLGRISFELLNSSAATVSHAVFTVHVGDQWYHIATDSIAPKERKRVQRELDFGVIERELSGDLSGWAVRGAEMFWDNVRADSEFGKEMMRRPELADQPIEDCPRVDISGIWKGDDGTEMQLSQRGVHPRGFIRGGRLAGSGRNISGVVDGTTFEGKMNEGGGVFKLKLISSGILEGNWSLKKVGPGPRAPRRR
jgi:hypothetical protein